jgi:hypothetical protein
MDCRPGVPVRAGEDVRRRRGVNRRAQCAQCAISEVAPEPNGCGRVQPAMTANIVVLQPLIALIAGILILIIPRLLNYIVAIYLIVIGLAGLSPHLLR